MKNIEKYFYQLETLTKHERVSLFCAAQTVMKDKTGINWCTDCDTCHEKVKEWLFSEAKPDAPKLSRFEHNLLLNLEENYRYIARDENGNLYCYYGMPSKDRTIWKSISNSAQLKPFNDLFDMVQWEDAQPSLIEDLLKMEVISYED